MESFVNQFKKRQLRNKKQLYTYMQREKLKSDKRSYKNSLPQYWKTTTTKKVVWIFVMLTIVLWIVATSMYNWSAVE